jgi:hypothetical protein
VTGRDAVEALAVRFEKAQCAIVQDLYHYLPLMDLAVMEAAELHKVRELGLASLCPVVNVVCVHIARVRAARKSAAAIACVERAT